MITVRQQLTERETIMLKRIMKVLLAVSLLVLSAGCSPKNPDDRVDPPVEGDETFFSINDREFHLDKETSFKGLGYLISSEFAEVTHEMTVPYVQYNYWPEDGNNMLYFRIFYYNNRDVSYALNDLGLESDIEMTDGRTADLQYKLYVDPRDDGGTIHFYFIERDSDLYAVSFISRYDISVFEGKVLNSIHFTE